MNFEEEVSDHTEKTLGALAIVCYYITVLYPYLSSYRLDKIGWSYPKNDKYILISTAMENVKYKTLCLLCGIMSISFFSAFYYYKNLFKPNDGRITIPILTYLMILLITSLVYIGTSYYRIHNILAMILVICSLALVSYIFFEYDNYFEEVLEVKSIEVPTILSFIFAILTISVGFAGWINNYFLKKPYKQWKSFLWNLLGICELSLFITVGSVLAVLITYPPLPDKKYKPPERII